MCQYAILNTSLLHLHNVQYVICNQQKCKKKNYFFKLRCTRHISFYKIWWYFFNIFLNIFLQLRLDKQNNVWGLGAQKQTRKHST